MKRHRQTLDELVSLLSPVDTTWMDDHSVGFVCPPHRIVEWEEFGRWEDVKRV